MISCYSVKWFHLWFQKKIHRFVGFGALILTLIFFQNVMGIRQLKKLNYIPDTLGSLKGIAWSCTFCFNKVSLENVTPTIRCGGNLEPSSPPGWILPTGLLMSHLLLLLKKLAWASCH